MAVAVTEAKRTGYEIVGAPRRTCRNRARSAPIRLGTAGGTMRQFPPRASEDAMTVSSYILIQTEVGKASAVVAAVRTLPGVVQADDVTGPYDVILRAEAVVDRRARPHGRVADPARRRHHPHPDLPGRPPVGRRAVMRLWPTLCVGLRTHRELSQGRGRLGGMDDAAAIDGIDDRLPAPPRPPPSRVDFDRRLLELAGAQHYVVARDQLREFGTPRQIEYRLATRTDSSACTRACTALAGRRARGTSSCSPRASPSSGANAGVVPRRRADVGAARAAPRSSR